MLTQHDSCVLASCVEEYAPAFRGADQGYITVVGKPQMTIFIDLAELQCREAILSFRCPLLLLAKLPLKEDGGKPT